MPCARLRNKVPRSLLNVTTTPADGPQSVRAEIILAESRRQTRRRRREANQLRFPCTYTAKVYYGRAARTDVEARPRAGQ